MNIEQLLNNIVQYNDCHIWKGAVGNNGYGRVYFENKTQQTHRVVFKHFNPTIDITGLCICHTCDTPTCINPAHLWIGTHKQNQQDAKNKGRTKRHAILPTKETMFSNNIKRLSKVEAQNTLLLSGQHSFLKNNRAVISPTGVLYPSVTAAITSSKICQATMYKRLKNPNSGWRYADDATYPN